MPDEIFGLSYYPAHVRRCCGLPARGGNDLHRVVVDVVAGDAMSELAAWLEIIPEKKMRRACMSQTDLVLPGMVVKDFWRVAQFVRAHGPSAVVALTMVNTIAGMKRTGLCRGDYAALTAQLDSHPPGTFEKYRRTIMEFEECEP